MESGEDLVKQAMRNPEFGVGHLEKWAEMLQILKDISGNRMPSVADLLKQAAQAPGARARGPRVARWPDKLRSTSRRQAVGRHESPAAEQAAGPSPLSISNRPSNPLPQRQAGLEEEQPEAAKPAIADDSAGRRQEQGRSSAARFPAGQKLDEAVTKQQDLLAEFDKVAEELNRVLANLEGSTLVKRLKAESRVQTRIATRLGDQVSEPSALPAKRPDKEGQTQSERGTCGPGA